MAKATPRVLFDGRHLAVLAAIEEGAATPAEIAEMISQACGQPVRTATVYATLSDLASKGMVTAGVRDGIAGRPPRTYALGETGRTALGLGRAIEAALSSRKRAERLPIQRTLC